MTLLPNEPRLCQPEQQRRLTARYLRHVTPALEHLLTQLRAQLDPALASAQPLKHGKAYPLGQCLEISLAVQQAIQRLDPRTLDRRAAEAYTALASFLHHGGVIRQVWGDLRGQYFQNAFLIGTLYVDVANDSVDRHKPPVEILPLADSGLIPIADYAHFSRIARAYWQAELYPNHLLPTLAPYFPLISLTAGGTPRLQAGNDYMLALTQRQAFAPSAAILRQGLLMADS
jgi:hypothetical protein